LFNSNLSSSGSSRILIDANVSKTDKFSKDTTDKEEKWYYGNHMNPIKYSNKPLGRFTYSLQHPLTVTPTQVHNLHGILYILPNQSTTQNERHHNSIKSDKIMQNTMICDKAVYKQDNSQK
jgi:hypothetical protein